MNPEKALDTLVKIYKDNDELVHELHELKVLVDRATPKKAIKDYYTKHPNIEFNWRCPSCNNGLLLWFDEVPSVSDEFCSYCGQHIDWSDEDEKTK